MPCTQPHPDQAPGRTVALVTLGCVRNEVDSEELAGRLEAAGWRLVDDAAQADVAVVNTCGFVEQAKKDSIDTVLEAADLRADGTVRTRAVVAVGCLAERYGAELEQALPEADAVLGFDSYADLAGHLDAVLHGRRPAAHVPTDRRALLPLAPAARPTGFVDHSVGPDCPPAPGWTAMGAAQAGLRLRPTVCLLRDPDVSAVPSSPGRPAEVLAEASWLAEPGSEGGPPGQ